MKTPSVLLPLGALVLLGAAAPSCSLTSDEFSCAVSLDSKRVRCVDYDNVGIAFRATIETLCRGIGGDFSTKNACPVEGKVGGCRQVTQNYTQTSWYYVDSIAPTPAEAAARCGGGEEFVPVDGMTVDLSAATPDLSIAQDLSASPADLSSHD